MALLKRSPLKSMSYYNKMILHFIVASLILASFNTHAITVTKLATSGQHPTARDAAAITTLGEDIYLFGGVKDDFASKVNHFYNDLYRFNVKTNTWEKLSPAGDTPSPRGYATAVADEKSGTLYVFGGAYYCKNFANMTMYNDLFAYSVKKNNWTRLHPLNSPPPRAQPMMWLMNDKLYIYGGANAKWEILPNMWEYSLTANQWHQVVFQQPQTNIPEPIQEPVGGLVAGNQKLLTYDDKGTWEFDVETKQWENIIPSQTNNRSLPQVAYANAAMIGNYLYLQGGDLQSSGSTKCGSPYPQNPTNSLWRFDISKRAWSQITKVKGGPLPRIKWSSSVAVKNNMYIFLGYDFQCNDKGNGPGQLWNMSDYVLNFAHD
ncbi:N-acetylneuraminic acid mutarotase [Legionella beliardensis]|uniref:N-acetylneuraminic acid mutarotase n=1 Tax=Legionella beliardensis TaxID=91822 RepID=A0A378I002_9GAMM|nr:kelch repeat-containing protein [Legionella beliardensis]STX27975.1 N-acetylneuraminic acid mutarotase [Legionella beliardensis]